MTAAGAPMRIDFVSDVVCPWCAIGLAALEQALERIGDDVHAQIHFQPFELNPQMPPQGQGIHAVPAVIINDRHLIQGGQPAGAFEPARRRIAAEN